MRKYKVLKPLPFVSVGDIIEVNDFYVINLEVDTSNPAKGCMQFNKLAVIQLIQDGWISEVEEEKSLNELFGDEFYGAVSDTTGKKCFWTMKKSPSQLSEIARKHENERYLKLIEKTYKKWTSKPWTGGFESLFSVLYTTIEKGVDE